MNWWVESTTVNPGKVGSGMRVAGVIRRCRTSAGTPVRVNKQRKREPNGNQPRQA